MHVQYGSGAAGPLRWLNFDGSPRLRLERNPVSSIPFKLTGKKLFQNSVRFGDIVRGLPVADASADGAYCSHVLEHLYRDDMAAALANTFRILKPGGVFRLIVPDLEWRARVYAEVQSGDDPLAADDFMTGTLLGAPKPPKGLEGYVRSAFGNAEHRWMYDFGAMHRLLSEAGFVDIRRCEMGDSEDPMFEDVEDRSRFFSPTGHAELAIHCIRPQ